MFALFSEEQQKLQKSLEKFSKSGFGKFAHKKSLAFYSLQMDTDLDSKCFHAYQMI